MAQMSAVKEAVKDSLVGSEDAGLQMSTQTRARFMSNAIKDPATGELYLGNDEFVKAVTPKNEDFVSSSAPWRARADKGSETGRELTAHPGQNSTRSSRSSTRSCSAWPTASSAVASPWATGPSSRTS